MNMRKILSIIVSMLLVCQSIPTNVYANQDLNSTTLELEQTEPAIGTEDSQGQGEESSEESTNPDESEESSGESTNQEESEKPTEESTNPDELEKPTEESVNPDELEEENEQPQDLEEESTEVVEESTDLVGEVYEKVKKTLPPVTYSLGKYIPEEYKMDINELENLTYLVPKTENEYEIVLSHNDGSYSFLAVATTLEEARAIADNSVALYNLDNDKIPCIIDNDGNIVYATNAMARVIKYVDGVPYPKNDKNTDMYTSASGSNAYTYINHGYVDDAPIIETSGNRTKIEVGGYTGWVNSNTNLSEYDIAVVPMNQVKNPSYYKVSNGELIHFISSNIESSSASGNSIRVGKAPSFMREGVKYFSYDGKYFYQDLNTLIDDAKNNTHNNSVNSSSDYYAYYMYLPFRSKTSYTAADIDNYINNNTPSDSKLRNTGEIFIEKQDKYGVNAIIMLGIAMNESAKGTSSIAKTKNNLFGINAVDSNTGNATTFNSVEDCIDQFAKYYISRGYADPQDWRYRGQNLGDKNLGANVKYASDPFWGEKAARYSYDLDYYLSGKNVYNLRDYDRYQLAIYTQPNEVKTKTGDLLYSVKNGVSSNSGNVGNSLIVYSDDKYQINNVDSYKINPSRTTAVANGVEFSGNYNWIEKAYVKTSGIKYINDGKYGADITTEDPVYIDYQVYGQDYGWQDWTGNGQTAGTTGQNKRIEAIKINIPNAPDGMKLKYRVHGANYGWTDWVDEGEIAGTIGSDLRLEAIEIKLEGSGGRYGVEYRVHGENYGWQEWKNNGQMAGTSGQRLKLEAIEIRIVQEPVYIDYQVYGQDYGWQNWTGNGNIAGTTGQNKRMEAIKINAPNAPAGMKIKYRVHGANYGWTSWMDEGEIAGTVGNDLRLEAIQIKLVGAPSQYTIEYRVHGENYGWQEWKENGDLAGTTGERLKLEAIEIRIVKR